MHDKHGNEIHLRDVVIVPISVWAPPAPDGTPIATGYKAQPRPGIVTSLYPEQSTCNIGLAVPYVSERYGNARLESLGTQVILMATSANASDAELWQTGDGRAIELGPYAVPAWVTPAPAPVSAGAAASPAPEMADPPNPFGPPRPVESQE